MFCLWFHSCSCTEWTSLKTITIALFNCRTSTLHSNIVRRQEVAFIQYDWLFICFVLRYSSDIECRIMQHAFSLWLISRTMINDDGWWCCWCCCCCCWLKCKVNDTAATTTTTTNNNPWQFGDSQECMERNQNRVWVLLLLFHCWPITNPINKACPPQH